MCERFIDKFTEKVIEKNKNPLKLYLVERPESLPVDYDQYNRFVVATYTEKEARETNPIGEEEKLLKYYSSYWVKKDQIDLLIIKEIGTASKNLEPGIIISDFLHG